MSADPFNFGPPNQFPASQPSAPPGPGGAPSGPAGNPFSGSVPNNPLSAPSASPPPSGPPATPFGAPQPTQPGQNNVFGPATTAPPAGLTAAKPPTWLLFVAAGLALAAGIVALLLDSPVIAIVCWFVAGPIAIGLLALFVVKDTFARSSGLYAAPGWVKPLHYVAIGLCLVCILAPALRIADWVGHL